MVQITVNKWHMLPGLSDQCPWDSIRKIEFSEEQCWPQIEAQGHCLAAWATIWQYGPLFGSDIVKTE